MRLHHQQGSKLPPPAIATLPRVLVVLLWMSAVIRTAAGYVRCYPPHPSMFLYFLWRRLLPCRSVTTSCMDLSVLPTQTSAGLAMLRRPKNCVHISRVGNILSSCGLAGTCMRPFFVAQRRGR
ncbi:hypothetical protein DFH08DRAFT_840443 [Mycena albidolilacea]|uniref:Uncharacterized protein n=1 Tax=Mycena albidolilacea TaxID=1033008 RepID=A0AAD7AQ63_9AGAR|nr:hypothetical protein DFH08DRAFT_840443 [Mycena albidolilacea]